MKKRNLIILLICVALLFTASCGANTDEEKVDGNADMANPFVECENIAAAEELTGFEFGMADISSEFASETISAIENSLIQVVYKDGEDNEVSFRKGVGEEDISGDYTAYSVENEVEVAGHKITLKGSDEGFNVAIWSEDGYAYCVRSSLPIAEDVVTGYVESMLSTAIVTVE